MVHHGHWISGPPTPYPQPTPKLVPAASLPHVHSVPGTPNWIMTPLPSQFVLPAPQFQQPAPHPPEEHDLPPLIPDPYDEEDDDDTPIATPNQPFRGPPLLPPGPVPPYGYLATPLPAVPALGIPSPRRRRKRRIPTDPLQLARMRALSETSISILQISRSRVEGRPSHWRPGYRSSACTRLKNCFTKLACVSSIHTLHSLISYKPRHQFPLLLDLRCPYTTVVFQNPERHFNIVDLHQLATTPPTHEMQLYHPLLPWFVNVRASTSSGITVGDLLQQLCANLEANIVPTDYNNNVISAEDREQIANAYHLRVSESLKSLARGVRKIDFLGPQVLFRGLTRTREGWFIKTTSLY
ncbi:hypothetical protein DFH05DRAFT_525760 [Lentinula detonsa]|uniref:DUF6699 domain-containing protein n=1 Tax=Lentinula detonsa TaxID=2804962 RepID=A0A9W8NS20_9AGAR|nr:hypothetical protein DFH05DRAFT_525760 [Lentinula detonsa]